MRNTVLLSAKRHMRYPPFAGKLPAPIFCRTEYMPPHGAYPVMCHEWGEFVYSFRGITEVRTDHSQYLLAPYLGMWIPERTEHIALNDNEAIHSSVYIHAELCRTMPGETCIIMVSPLVRAILEHLRGLSPEQRQRASTIRLLHVLVDQLASCVTLPVEMPQTDDVQISRVLSSLKADIADNRSLSQIAADFNLSERTLIRKAQRELGMSLTEWRQRLKIIRALSALQNGQSVESVALDSGYSTSSAFIAMFRRFMGMSPRKFTAQILPSDSMGSSMASSGVDCDWTFCKC